MYRLKEFYKRNYNFMLSIAFGLFGLYVFVLEVLLELLPLGGLIMYATSLRYIKKFFVQEASRKE